MTESALVASSRSRLISTVTMLLAICAASGCALTLSGCQTHASPLSTEPFKIFWVACDPENPKPIFSIEIDEAGYVRYVGSAGVSAKEREKKISSRSRRALADRISRYLEKNNSNEVPGKDLSALCMIVSNYSAAASSQWINNQRLIAEIDDDVRSMLPIKEWVCPALASPLSVRDYCGPLVLSFFKRDVPTCEVQYGVDIYSDRTIHFWARGTDSAASHVQDRVTKLTANQFASLGAWIDKQGLDNGCCKNEKHPVPITRSDVQLIDELQHFISTLTGLGWDAMPQTDRCLSDDPHVNLEPFLLIRPEYFR